MFSELSEMGARSVFASTLTRFGNEQFDSKTLVMNAVKNHYPHLANKYENFFGSSNELPKYYRDAFNLKKKELSKKYGLVDKIE